MRGTATLKRRHAGLQKRRGQGSGWKARATKRTSRRHQTEHRTLSVAIPFAASRLRVRPNSLLDCAEEAGRVALYPSPQSPLPFQGRGVRLWFSRSQKDTKSSPRPQRGRGVGGEGDSHPGQPPLGPSTTQRTVLGLESPSYGKGSSGDRSGEAGTAVTGCAACMPPNAHSTRTRGLPSAARLTGHSLRFPSRLRGFA